MTAVRALSKWACFCHQLLALAAVLAIPLFVSWRVELVDSRIGRAFGLDGKYDLAVINADSTLVAVVGLLLVLSWRGRFLVGLALRSIALVLMLLYLTDLLLLAQFGTRVLYSSFQLYSEYTALVWEQLRELLGGLWPALAKLSLVGVFALALLMPPRKPWKLSVLSCTILISGSVAVALMPWRVDYANAWIVDSYLNANIFVPETRTYSEKNAADLLAAPVEPPQCVAGLAERRNVVILIIESLSSYQSQRFGGIYDWTPELDAIAADAVVYPRVHANGFSTNEGLIGILGGVRLFSPFAHRTRAVVPFQTGWGLDQTLPREFKQAGYHTAFLTTGPLSFSAKGDWLRDIGFDEIEGNENPFYRDWRKIQFGAASDEALYARTLDWIASRQGDRPWMLTLETVSTHQPFRNPETLLPDLEQAFRYADRQAASFIRALQASGYFNNGILLVLGDHRSMTPMSRAEQEIFGAAAWSRVPFWVLGHGAAGVHSGNFQLSDLLPSFRHWLRRQYCHHGELVSLFAPKSDGRCALHVRGARPSLVDVICPKGHGLVQLDGDDTRFVRSTGITEAEQTELLRIIAQQRLAGHRRHLDYLSNIEEKKTD